MSGTRELEYIDIKTSYDNEATINCYLNTDQGDSSNLKMFINNTFVNDHSYESIAPLVIIYIKIF